MFVLAILRRTNARHGFVCNGNYRGLSVVGCSCLNTIIGSTVFSREANLTLI